VRRISFDFNYWEVQKKAAMARQGRKHQYKQHIKKYRKEGPSSRRCFPVETVGSEKVAGSKLEKKGGHV